MIGWRAPCGSEYTVPDVPKTLLVLRDEWKNVKIKVSIQSSLSLDVIKTEIFSYSVENKLVQDTTGHSRRDHFVVHNFEVIHCSQLNRDQVPGRNIIVLGSSSQLSLTCTANGREFGFQGHLHNGLMIAGELWEKKPLSSGLHVSIREIPTRRTLGLCSLPNNLGRVEKSEEFVVSARPTQTKGNQRKTG
ncbi:hypothetical protein RF11_07405 [Thelohanellus kitauei]|uniref:Uncharacterized protein n=1 Tax=Thelohanellus kitauei TaxID=669202 RepID=A0A0C2J9K9_THEKT|nr:hypothetical protein RF11_07405 [Thelohanellus kitauei]